MAAQGDRLFLTGGSDGTSMADVLTATVSTDGTVSAWTALPSLPQTRSHQASVLHNGWLYLVAGLRGDPSGTNIPLADVIRAPVDVDGRLGDWVSDRALPIAVATHSAEVFNGYLYVAGGVEATATITDHIRRARIQSDGSLGLWEEFPIALPVARSHMHQMPMYQQWVYAIAGQDVAFNPMASVSVGTFE